MRVTPTAANVLEYAAIVRDRALLRRLGEAADEINTMVYEETGEAVYADANVQALAQFYGQYLVRKDIVTQTVEDADGEYASSRWTKKCYLMGLQSADEENNPNVVQTIGWNSTFGGMGVFDPLSDNPQTTR